MLNFCFLRFQVEISLVPNLDLKEEKKVVRFLFNRWNNIQEKMEFIYDEIKIENIED